ncbi:YeeE/YedE thiosulfate transporter family protein [Paenirhodobacter sp.]|uniref:YeeE/YedE thiosulfate transporter family protein n=1 Tax=Paenirhodobacter sp. TaxID=1965326 RepID=UPI003B417AE7
MAISVSCVSAHLYRLGEGAFGSLVVPGGFVLGFLSWNILYLLDLYRAGVIWLPGSLGYGGRLAVLGALALVLLRHPFLSEVPASHWRTAVLHRRWPPVLADWIAVLAYFRVGPLGVTAERGSLASTAGWLPATLHGFTGCATVVKKARLSRNGVFVLGMVLAAAPSATLSGDWSAQWRCGRDLPRLCGGGRGVGFARLHGGRAAFRHHGRGGGGLGFRGLLPVGRLGGVVAAR